MAEFTGTFTETFELPVDVATAVAHFKNTETIARYYGILESAEPVGDDGLAIVLPEQNHGIATFKGRYTGRWASPAEDRVTWDTAPASGNMVSVGSATFTARGEGCTMAWDSRITINLDVNRFVAKAVQPIVSTFVAREMKAYVLRMIGAL